MRNRFLGKDGRPPPLRGIVKEFGEVEARLRESDAMAMFNNMVDMHQLGIFRLDIEHHQFVNNKLSDLSQAITFPHFATNPEWNPHLTPEQIAAMEYDVFRWTLGDYVRMDYTIQIWNEAHKRQKDKVRFRALPDAMMKRKHNLRQTPARGPQCPYVLFDPRGYDWKASDTSVGDGATGTAPRGTALRGTAPRQRWTDEKRAKNESAVIMGSLMGSLMGGFARTNDG
ncbi:hypothetical protein QQZ08_008481 [Neonectria magnoliae]|uniref:Uncharacterized protein n=1 Tax=Neonectria magnoliae TaxID=2732573 RepID=A0ABR1HUY3_9HYPO